MKMEYNSDMDKKAAGKLVVMNGDQKTELDLSLAELGMLKMFFDLPDEKREDLLEILKDGDPQEILLYINMLMEQNNGLRS